MAYRVRIEESDVEFEFADVDDALNFMIMAGEYGSVEDYHLVKDENDKYQRVSDGWRPVKVHFEKVDDANIYANGVPMAEVSPDE